MCIKDSLGTTRDMVYVSIDATRCFASYLLIGSVEIILRSALQDGSFVSPRN
jgi:hypothetical protein